MTFPRLRRQFDSGIPLKNYIVIFERGSSHSKGMGDPLTEMYYIYILQSQKDKRTYVGYTNNLEERLKKHNSGQVKSTKHRQPLKLLFSEEFETSPEARKRELYWKNGGGRRKLKEMFSSL